MQRNGNNSIEKVARSPQDVCSSRDRSPIIANLLRTFLAKTPTKFRHPERSAAQIHRVNTERLVAREVRRACPERSRGNPGSAYLTQAARSFRTPKPENSICCGTYLMVTGTSFAFTVKRACMAAKNVDEAAARRKMLTVLFLAPGKGRGSAQCGLRWVKRSEQHGRDKHRRCPSTPRHKRCVHAMSL